MIITLFCCGPGCVIIYFLKSDKFIFVARSSRIFIQNSNHDEIR